MSHDQSVQAEAGVHMAPQYTMPEILRQPPLWPVTLRTVHSTLERMQLTAKLQHARGLLTGAGTLAYAATTVASAWPRACAVSTTGLLADAERYLVDSESADELSVVLVS